jgi:hypothetical protein
MVERLERAPEGRAEELPPVVPVTDEGRASGSEDLTGDTQLGVVPVTDEDLDQVDSAEGGVEEGSSGARVEWPTDPEQRQEAIEELLDVFKYYSEPWEALRSAGRNDLVVKLESEEGVTEEEAGEILVIAIESIIKISVEDAVAQKRREMAGETEGERKEEKPSDSAGVEETRQGQGMAAIQRLLGVTGRKIAMVSTLGLVLAGSVGTSARTRLDGRHTSTMEIEGEEKEPIWCRTVRERLRKGATPYHRRLAQSIGEDIRGSSLEVTLAEKSTEEIEAMVNSILGKLDEIIEKMEEEEKPSQEEYNKAFMVALAAALRGEAGQELGRIIEEAVTRAMQATQESRARFVVELGAAIDWAKAQAGSPGNIYARVAAGGEFTLKEGLEFLLMAELLGGGQAFGSRDEAYQFPGRGRSLGMGLSASLEKYFSENFGLGVSARVVRVWESGEFPNGHEGGHTTVGGGLKIIIGLGGGFKVILEGGPFGVIDGGDHSNRGVGPHGSLYIRY